MTVDRGVDQPAPVDGGEHGSRHGSEHGPEHGSERGAEGSDVPDAGRDTGRDTERGTDSVVAQSPLDAAAIRREFPILGRLIHGQRLVYLDSGATSQKPQAVLDSVNNFYERHNANVHRGLYTLSSESTNLYEDAREQVARFIGAAGPEEIVFTRGATEAINLVACSWASGLGAGDTVVLTEMEHHSNLVPWQLAAQRQGFKLRHLLLTDDGRLDLSNLDEVLDGSVKLLSFVHVSNALGTVNPVAELVSAAHDVGALVLLDGAQSAPHMPVDVGALDADFLAFSGHKMLAPTGIGCLWARRDLLEEMPPYQGGGEMIHTVQLESSTFAQVPARFEAGTPPIAQAIGLAEATRYLDRLGMDRVHDHSRALVDYALPRLEDVPGLRVYGPHEERAASVTFTLEGVHPHDIASILDHRGIAVRAGHHCTMPVHTRFGIPATARASFYVYNGFEDIDALVDGLRHVREVFGLSA